MTHMQSPPKCEIGMVGLGTMGQNMLLNMRDHGFLVAGYDKNRSRVEDMRQAFKDDSIHVAYEIKEFVALLRRPRAVMLLVPAGAIVDSVIKELLPYLQAGDLIIDAGNSYFKDTDVRCQHLRDKGILFLGVGISGGEEGARHGPSIMPGGVLEAYERVRPLFEAIAAKINGDPCVRYIGSGSSGHFVKMVHNGIEYGLMQLIAETYDLMKRGLDLNNDQLATIYNEWNQGELNSYLLEITSHIFKKVDLNTGHRLLDEIRDAAVQKGTGMWASQTAMTLQVPIPTIDIAVSMRDLSGWVTEREEIHASFQRPISFFKGDQKLFLTKLRDSFLLAMIIIFTQGMALLRIASIKYNYQLNLEAIARIWRGGCIIRAKLLEDIRMAFRTSPNLMNLLLDPNLAQKLKEHEEDLREIVCTASKLGVPAPAFMVSLGYLDAYRSAWLPANLIQAQRDYFGAHTYELINGSGPFHTDWKE